MEGKPAKISQERINALNAIGLEWFPRKSMKAEDGTSSGDKRTPEMTRASRRSTRVTDRYSGATPTAISAKSPHLERRQSSQSKSQRLDDGGGRVANATEERITSMVPVRHLSKRTSIATSLTRKRVAPTAGESTKKTPVANRDLRKRAVPPTAAGHWTNTVPQRSSPRLNPRQTKEKCTRSLWT